MPAPLAAALWALHALDVALLFVYGLHPVILAVLSARRGRAPGKEGHGAGGAAVRQGARPPMITVQVPLYNERYVATRVIEAACRLRHPRELLEIQILDDSTDDTLRISSVAVERFRAEGVDIRVLHRSSRTGYKAGALREGMEKARGELVAVFDADFVPDPGFLEETWPLFHADTRLGMVQTRWGHLNADQSPLTRAQALMIDVHYGVEQTARSANGLFLSFDGSAGVWRRACILDAGNWQDDTLTEDLDLSYRAQMRGWRLSYVGDIVCRCELPARLDAYRCQQYRWAKGSIQTMRKMLRPILRSDAGWFRKTQALLHLSYYAIHALLILNLLLVVPAVLAAPASPGSSMASLLSVPLMIGFLAPAFVAARSQRALYGHLGYAVSWMPFLFLFGTGLAVSNTRAVIEGMLRMGGEFIRTPKKGGAERAAVRAGQRSVRGASEGGYRAHPGAHPWWVRVLEVAAALLALGGMAAAIARGSFLVCLPLALYAASFLTVTVYGVGRGGGDGEST